MILCKNSKCLLRWQCKKYKSLFELHKELNKHQVEIFECIKGKCEQFEKLKS